MAAELTEKMELYLAALPLCGGGVAAACRSAGINDKNLSKWRKNPAFREAEDNIRAQHVETKLGDRWGNLPKLLRIYLYSYQDQYDRMKACRASGLTWATVKAMLKEKDPDPETLAFQSAVAEVEEEIEVALYDAQLRRAIDTGEAAVANSIRKATAAKTATGAGDRDQDRQARVERIRREKAGAQPN